MHSTAQMFKLTSDWGSNGYRQRERALECILSKRAKSTELSRSDIGLQ